MNLLEHYIKEVHSVEDCVVHPDMLIVDFTYNCYGAEQRSRQHFFKDDWEKCAERGYFWG